MIACPICEAPSLAPFLHREQVPVHQNLLMPDRAAARALRHGTLDLHACAGCGFVFNAAFDASRLSYGAQYDNTQTSSPAFAAYVVSLADRLVHQGAVQGRRIIEIGCGKGGFLRALVERDPDSEGLGLDPSYLGPESDLNGRLRFERRMYDSSCGPLGADVIVCRHVIEHVADPVALLRMVRQTLTSADARVFFETPSVEWILANRVVWDFFYEHCSYFSEGALARAFEAAGFVVEGVSRVFGGQYLWAEARPARNVAITSRDGVAVAGLADSFATHETQLVAALVDRLEALRRSGPLAIWGAGAKGVTLASLVDPDCRLAACVVDLNPQKQGRFLPGTGHPIVAPADLARYDVKSAVLTNPNYLNENTALLQELGLDTALVDLMRTDINADAY